MLQRNMSVKRGPQRFQDEHTLQFELIFTFELRVFDLVVEGTNSVVFIPAQDTPRLVWSILCLALLRKANSCLCMAPSQI